MFFNHQAIVKLERKEIVITTFNHPYENELQAMYDNLFEKLKNKDIEPNVSWLGGYPLRFEFK